MIGDAAYDFEGHTLNHGGYSQHYLDEGSLDADPVVMVHGNPTWSFYYRHLVRALRDDYRVIVPDHVGCGRSETPPRTVYDYSLKSRVDDLERLLDGIDANRRVTLVLHDWGGMIGMAWAARHPDAVARLVLLNTAAFPLPREKTLPWQIKWCRTPLLGPLLVQGLNMFCRGAMWTCTTKSLPSDVKRMYLQPYSSWRERLAVLEFVRTIPLRPTAPGWDIVTDTANSLFHFAHLPIVICWGEKDFVFDGHFRKEWEARYPRAEMHRLANAGHFVLEDAREHVVDTVTNFLRLNPIPTGDDAEAPA